MTELLVALTLGTPIGAGLIAWFANPRWAPRLAITGLVVGIAAAGMLALRVFGGGPLRAFDGLVALDPLGAYVVLLVVAVASIGLAASPGHLAHERAAGTLQPHHAGRYYALFGWFVAGLAAVPMTDNLGLLWVGIEATTIVSALLVGFSRTASAIEAAWKYLILGSVGVGFALLGTLLVYASSVGILGETSDALAWSRLAEIAPRLDPAFVRLAFVFALVGYGTKAGLAPFHTWLPDAHSQAPSPVSAVLSGAALAVSLYALARFHLIAVGALGTAFSATLLIGFGLLSLAVALPFIVAQGDLKRLLAYSSIEHLGLATLALGFGGRLALLGLTLHLASHGLAKSTVFVAAGRLVAERGTRRIGRLAGSLERSPADGRALLAATMVLGGLPPSGIFVAELAIVFGGVAAGWGIAAAATAALLGFALAGFLFHVVRVSIGRGERRGGADRAPTEGAGLEAGSVPFDSSSVPPAEPAVRSSLGHSLLLAVPIAVVVIAGLWTPGPVATAFEQVVDVLGGRRG
jgi:hydrogenase-4 component F